jgi:membrane protease YdiL (CAAX protease family)
MTSLPPESPSTLRRIFLSPDRRLRSGWRLLVHALLTFALAIAFSLPIVVAMVVLTAFNIQTDSAELLISSVPTFLAFVLATFLARRLLDRRSFTSLGLRIHRRAWLDVGMGICISAVMMGAILLAEMMLGWVRLDGFAWETHPAWVVLTGFLVSLGLFILVGIDEEILSRGYQLQNLVEGLNLPWGLVLSSLIFAIMHLGNPSVVWYTVIPGLMAAGLFLAFGWVRTRELWLPIGLHIGWNLFEGPVFGFPVSGLATSQLLLQTPTGPVWFTGGSFGPEAGVVLLPGLFVGTLLVWLYTSRRLPSTLEPSQRSATPN